jgi:hypothetical protein
MYFNDFKDWAIFEQKWVTFNVFSSIKRNGEQLEESMMNMVQLECKIMIKKIRIMFHTYITYKQLSYESIA